MNEDQEEIFRNKRTFLYYYKDNLKKGYLIPDTEKARQKAIDDGAKYFDTFSFCRNTNALFKPARIWGDLYIQFKSTTYSMKDEDLIHAKNIISCFFDRKGFLSANAEIIKIIMLGKQGFALSIPARLFQICNGDTLLSEIYEYITKSFMDYFKQSSPNSRIFIPNTQLTDIENIRNRDGYNIPLSYYEFSLMNCAKIQALSQKQKPWKPLIHNAGHELIFFKPLYSLKNSAQKIYVKSCIKKLMKCDVVSKIYQEIIIPQEQLPLFVSVINTFPPSIKKTLLTKLKKKVSCDEYLYNVAIRSGITCNEIKGKGLCRAIHCNKNAPIEMLIPWQPVTPLDRERVLIEDLNTVKCAISIMQNMFCRNINEFQARDAHRFVRGSYRTMDKVEYGLRLLEKHNFLLRCVLPKYSCPGRRPSPWFLVNPNGRKKLLEN